jgi:hypothetical protein
LTVWYAVKTETDEAAADSRSQDFGVLDLANGSCFKASDGAESKE